MQKRLGNFVKDKTVSGVYERLAGSKVVQACGFGHHYGGYESDSRINKASVDSTGKVWPPEHRHFVKGIVVGGLATGAVGLTYGAQQIGESLGVF